MKNSDMQTIEHILSYCNDVADTVKRYGDSFDVFKEDRDYANSV